MRCYVPDRDIQERSGTVTDFEIFVRQVTNEIKKPAKPAKERSAKRGNDDFTIKK